MTNATAISPETLKPMIRDHHQTKKQTKLHEQVDVQTKDSSLSNSSKQREEKIKGNTLFGYSKY